jgi:hypothetical protein
MNDCSSQNELSYQSVKQQQQQQQQQLNIDNYKYKHKLLHNCIQF